MKRPFSLWHVDPYVDYNDGNEHIASFSNEFNAMDLLMDIVFGYERRFDSGGNEIGLGIRHPTYKTVPEERLEIRHGRRVIFALYSDWKWKITRKKDPFLGWKSSFMADFIREKIAGDEKFRIEQRARAQEMEGRFATFEAMRSIAMEMGMRGTCWDPRIGDHGAWVWPKVVIEEAKKRFGDKLTIMENYDGANCTLTVHLDSA